MVHHSPSKLQCDKPISDYISPQAPVPTTIAYMIQKQFSHHFLRLHGVTVKECATPSRVDQEIHVVIKAPDYIQKTY